MRFQGTAALALAALSTTVAAHPGHDLTAEMAERRAFLGSVKRASLEHCADKLKARGVHDRNIRRRAAAVEKARQKRNIKKRDVDSVLATSHDKSDLGYTTNTDAATLFSGQNSCVLTPEVTQGPYYVGGEYVRTDVTEDEPGVSIVLDYQVIDVDTCEPVPNVYLEMWHCNATGVYSGIVASGNGDSTDLTNIDKTWLRGIQPTDDDGVAQFESIFPGHYTSRTTHIHVMAHTNATLLANQTLGNDVYASHVGQTFFDQDLITEVEKISPYSTNAQPLTTNADDGIFAEEAGTVDPVMEYTLLGDSVSDGLFAWIAFGINVTASQQITPAAFLYADGGVANANSGGPGGGGPGGAPPNGTAPGGQPPSGGPSGVPPTQDDVAAVSSSAAAADPTTLQTSTASASTRASYGLLALGQLFTMCMAIVAALTVLRA